MDPFPRMVSGDAVVGSRLFFSICVLYRHTRIYHWGTFRQMYTQTQSQRLRITYLRCSLRTCFSLSCSSGAHSCVWLVLGMGRIQMQADTATWWNESSIWCFLPGYNESMISSISFKGEFETSPRTKLNPDLILAQTCAISGIKSEVNALTARADLCWLLRNWHKGVEYVWLWYWLFSHEVHL